MNKKNLLFLSFRYMKQNKHRTITTIIGVALSAMLIYLVVAGGFSLYHATYKNNYNNSLGWDAVFQVDSIEKAEELVHLSPYYGVTSNLNVDTEVTNAFYCTQINSFYEDMNTCVTICAINDFGNIPFLFPIKYGVLPKNDSTILGSQYHCRTSGKSVGDSISFVNFQLVNNEKIDNIIELQISGIYNSDKFGGFYLTDCSIEGLSISSEDNFCIMSDELKESINEFVPVYVFLTYEEKNNLDEKTTELANLINTQKYVINEEAVNYFVEGNYSLNYTAWNAIILLISFIVAVCSLFLIRNAFNISASERNDDYGILRCIGMSRKQIISIILIECIFVTFIGLIFGIIFGHVLGIALFHVIRSSLELTAIYQMRIIPKAFLVTFAYTMVTSFYAMVAPIERLYRINPIEALHKKEDIKTKSIKKKKGTLLRKLFGTEIWYAYKNVNRRRGRFILNIVTLSIGATLFITLPTGFKIIENVFTNIMGLDTYDGVFEVHSYEGALDLKNALEKNDLITNSSIYFRQYSGLTLDTNLNNPDMPTGTFLGIDPSTVHEIYDKAYEYEPCKDSSAIEIMLTEYDERYKVGDSITFMDGNREVTFFFSRRIKSNDMLVFCRKYSIADYAGAGCIYDLPLIFDMTKWKGFINTEYFEVISVDEISLNIKLNDKIDSRNFDKFLENVSYNYWDMNIEIKQIFRVIKVIEGVLSLFLFILLTVFISNNINLVRSDMMLRRDEFRTLRVLGMSYKQESKILYMEASIAAIIAFIISSILGTVLGNTYARLFMYNDLDSLSIPFGVDIKSIVIVLFILLFSSIITVFFSRESDILEA